MQIPLKIVFYTFVSYYISQLLLIKKKTIWSCWYLYNSSNQFEILIEYNYIKYNFFHSTYLSKSTFLSQFMFLFSCIKYLSYKNNTGMNQWDEMGWVVGGGFRMGNTCTPMADSSQCMEKPIQYCKVKYKLIN